MCRPETSFSSDGIAQLGLGSSAREWLGLAGASLALIDPPTRALIRSAAAGALLFEVDETRRDSRLEATHPRCYGEGYPDWIAKSG
jgi:hypothetical protein